MYKTIIAVLFFVTLENLSSQELKFDKSNLYFPLGLPYDTISVHNTGSAPLIIDSLYSKSGYLGYRLSILFKDSTIFDFVFGPRPFHVAINSKDSIRFAFGRPTCAICKVGQNFNDTLIVHSNSLSGNYSKISVGGEGSTLVTENNSVLYNYELLQNYPNPFNPITAIPFTVAEDGIVTITIYNNLGQQILVLFSGKLEAGNYIKSWDASEFASGSYFYKLETSRFNATKKMILLR
jgi:hypothetical protein